MISPKRLVSSMNNFLSKDGRDMLQRMSNMIRYNNAVHIHNENVAEHSFYVAMYAMCICDFLHTGDKFRSVAIEKALIHDVHEIEISDIPHNVKHSMEGLSEQCIKFEKWYNATHFTTLQRDLNEFSNTQQAVINIVVELADILSVRQYSQQEVEFGNVKRFGEIVESTNNRIDRCLEDLALFVETKKVEELRELIK